MRKKVEIGETDKFDISLSKASFTITNLFIDNLNRLMIDITPLNNDLGKLLKKNIGTYTFISKGTGTLINGIVDDYEFISAYVDIGKGAYEGIYTSPELRYKKLKRILK